MTARDLLADAGGRGVFRWADGPRLRWRCRGPLPEDLRTALAAQKCEVLAMLRASGPCPGCGRGRDEKGRCWGCCDRPCVACGRATGSAFIATCIPCGMALDETAG